MEVLLSFLAIELEEIYQESEILGWNNTSNLSWQSCRGCEIKKHLNFCWNFVPFPLLLQSFFLLSLLIIPNLAVIE
jgi:hypothetical protein